MKVAIIGTGNYAKALGNRISNAGIELVYGSRGRSESSPVMLNGRPILSPCNAVLGADIVILAIPRHAHEEFINHTYHIFEKQKSIIIDVSNQSLHRKDDFRANVINEKDDHFVDLESGINPSYCYTDRPCDVPEFDNNPFLQGSNKQNTINQQILSHEDIYSISHAEYLQMLIPCADVVKAFNTVSAYSLSTQPGTLPEDRVLVCADSITAKKRVMKLVNAIGMRPVDAGLLSAARDIEKRPLQLFQEWRTASKIALILFTFAYVFVGIRDIVLGEEHWSNLFLLKFNAVTGWVSLMLMLITFLAGTVAALKQLISGTSKVPFPNWLDKWLKSRKALGVIGLFFIGLHLVASSLTDNLFVDWGFLNTKQGIYYQVSMFLAILAAGVYVCLGITSIPSVGAGLSWREWNFIQSKLGIFGFLLGTLHLVFIALSIDDLDVKEWPRKVPPISLFVGIPAILLLIIRFLIAIPPLSTRLNRIRGIQ